jgi:transposase
VIARSNSAAVRNPIAADPDVARQMLFLTDREKEFLSSVLKRLSKQWRGKAEYAWKNHKPPMAAYWKQNAVNARHLALALTKAQS